MSKWFEKHKTTLEKAQQAINTREDWAAFAEIPSEKIYGEGSKKAGEEAFQALQGKPFIMNTPMASATFVDAEKQSPYGPTLGVTYPKIPVSDLLTRSQNAQQSWRKLDADQRAGICIEMLYRLAEQSFLMAHAVMHTTGQPFVMSFQAGGPHALDRGLEAIAYAYSAQTANELTAKWSKPIGKNAEGEKIFAHLDKTFITRGKGIGVVIGCATFPTWNSYPGIFANLATGNSVITKPAANATLPLAIAVDIMRTALQEAGINPDLVQMANIGGDRNYTQTLVQDSRVKMIDYTGGPGFGSWLQSSCPDTQLYLEQAGINNILIESTDNVRGMAKNIAFSLSLYGGQMCTAPQNIYIPKSGINTPEGKMTFDEVSQAIASSVEKLLSDDNRAFSILGAINSTDIKTRVGEATSIGQKSGQILLNSEPTQYEHFPEAVVAKPLLIAFADNTNTYANEEQFGPIAFIIACSDDEAALETVCNSITDHGAMTTSLYSVNDEYKSKAVDAIVDVGSPLSINLTGGIFVNQSAAYTDFHGSALNPAANTSLTDLGFVSQRFGWVTVREER